MLLGRAAERDRVDALLENARRGTSGVLLLRGEAGIGKTALLQEAAGSQDVRLLEARGVESETEVPFGALHELLRPLLNRLDTIPRPQAAALAGALALGPPVPGDPFAVAVGTLTLLAAAAEERPQLVVIDDAHWVDEASAAALLFAFRRFTADSIAVLLAVRDGTPSAFDDRGFDELRLEGLDEKSALSLLRHGAPTIDPAVADRLVLETGGNPLALTEAPAALSAEQLIGSEPLPDPVPAGSRLNRAFAGRVAALPDRTAVALLVAAASGDPRLDTVAEALGQVDLGEVLQPAEADGLVQTGRGRIDWRHPLVRSAVYHGASAGDRRRAHAALAAATSGAERAWHLAAAACEPDEEVARQLEATAHEARVRRGFGAAGNALARAAELTPDDGERARRLHAAGRDLALAGHPGRARGLLEEAGRLASDPVLAADVDGTRGELELWSGDGRTAYTILITAADRVERHDAAATVRLLSSAALAYENSGRVQPALLHAQRAYDLAQRAAPELRTPTEAMLLSIRILAGDARSIGPDVVRAGEVWLEGINGHVPEDLLVAATTGHSLTWLGEHAVARRMFLRHVDAARSAGAVGLLPFCLACLCELEFRTGRWIDAYADGTEAVRLAEETGQANVLGFALASVARVEAAFGRGDAARAHIARAVELAERYGAGSIVVYAWSVLGLLDLGAGRVEQAARQLDRLATLVAEFELRDPAVVQWRPDHVEALALAGRTDDALRALAALEHEVEATGGAWAVAAAARARALLSDDFESEFDRALRLHADRDMPFEQARTHLRLGERLRRSRRPVDARAPLHAALEVFDRLGAVPWSDRARHELAATGERVRRQPEAGLADLTPQELRVASLVGAGATNREAAAALFLSPKTVGYHLGKVYVKLGLNSRSQLAATLAAVGDETAPSRAGTVVGMTSPAARSTG